MCEEWGIIKRIMRYTSTINLLYHEDRTSEYSLEASRFFDDPLTGQIDERVRIN